MDAVTRAFIDDLATAVTGVFTDVETYLIEYLAWRVESDRTIWDVDADRLDLIHGLQVETRAMVNALRDITPELAQRVATLAAEQGARGIAAALLAVTPATGMGSVLDPAHLYAVQATVLDLTSAFEDVTNRVLRFPDDVWRRMDATLVAEKLTGQEHTIQFQREALADWYQRGIPSFVDVSGRRWSQGAYIEMVTRTGTQRALTEGRRAQAQAAGFTLGIIQEIPGCCDRCAPWAGAVVNLAEGGATGQQVVASALDGAPVTVHVAGTVDEARRQGWQHPNCRGSLGVFIPGATDSTDYLIDYDEARYDAEQALREQEREIRAAKRRLAINPDDADARRALNTARAKARDLIAEHDIPRRPYRESLAWSQPTSRRRRPPRPDLAQALTDLPILPRPHAEARGPNPEGVARWPKPLT